MELFRKSFGLVFGVLSAIIAAGTIITLIVIAGVYIGQLFDLSEKRAELTAARAAAQSEINKLEREVLSLLEQEAAAATAADEQFGVSWDVNSQRWEPLDDRPVIKLEDGRRYKVDQEFFDLSESEQQTLLQQLPPDTDSLPRDLLANRSTDEKLPSGFKLDQPAINLTEANEVAKDCISLSYSGLSLCKSSCKNELKTDAERSHCIDVIRKHFRNE